MKYNFGSTEIVDTKSGEIVNTKDLMKNITRISEKELVERLCILKELYVDCSNNYKSLETEFLKRMKNKKATKYEGDDVRVNISKNADYEYDIQSIEKLQKLIDKDKFEEAFTKKYKVNRSALKSLETLGGKIKTIIFNMQKVTEKKSTVIITKK